MALIKADAVLGEPAHLMNLVIFLSYSEIINSLSPSPFGYTSSTWVILMVQ